MRYDGERRPEEIEAEIERTRASMDATLNAIEGRLTPGQLVDQGLDYLRHSGANEFVSNLGHSVKQHPLPVTLVGLGVAWLMMADRLPGPSRPVDLAGKATSTVTAKATDAMHRMSGAVESVSERMSGTTQSARETLAHAAATARERASRVSETGRRQFEQARGGYEQMLREQPLALGAVGLAIGALVAAAIPRTRQEDELMGEASDRLARQARESGREQLDKAGRVAAAAREAAVGEAERQGLAHPAAQPSFGEEGRRDAGGPGAGKPAMGAEEEPSTVAWPGSDPTRRPEPRSGP
jgi:hypothetical protein